MIKYIVVLAVATVGCLLMSDLAYGDPISSTELINNAKKYDDSTVEYEGEVIGDIMRRGDHSWINVNDGPNAMGIWADNFLTENIVYTGSYKTKGDNIRITGTFHRACVEHGGDLDIHARSVAKVTSGSRIYEELDFNKTKTAFILSGILLILLLLGLLNHRK